MPTIDGTILLVQESRFRLVSGRGQSKLFVLASDAPLEPQDLAPLAREQQRVMVHFENADGLISLIAKDVTPVA